MIEPGIGRVRRTRRIGAIGIKAGPERRVLVERAGVDAPVLDAVEQAVIPIDVHRTEQDVLADGPVDLRQKVLGIGRRVGDHIDQDVDAVRGYGALNRSDVVSVYADAKHLAAVAGPAMARGTDHGCTARRQGKGRRVADHAAAAKNENLHRHVSMPRAVDICPGQ